MPGIEGPPGPAAGAGGAPDAEPGRASDAEPGRAPDIGPAVPVAVTPARARAALLAADRAFLTAAAAPPPPRWWIPSTAATLGAAAILATASPLHTTDSRPVRLGLQLAVCALVLAFLALYATRVVGRRVHPRLPAGTAARRVLRDGAQVAAVVLGGLSFVPLGRNGGALALGVLLGAATWWRETSVAAGHARLAARLASGPAEPEAASVERGGACVPAPDALLTDPVRLTSLAFLAGCLSARHEAVRDHVTVSDGQTDEVSPEEADAALAVLRDAGHLTVRASGTRTWLSLTPAGRTALTGHLAALRALVDAPRPAP